MTDFVNAECMVRQLHARYADAVWRKDLDEFGECFAEDCEWRLSGMVHRGRTDIVDHMGHVLPRLRKIFLTFRTPIVEVAHGSVSARTYVTEQSVLADGKPLLAIGTYYERFLIGEGRFRFSWRLFEAHYAGPPDLSGPFYDNLDYGPPPAMPPLDADTFDRTGIQSAARGKT